MNYKRIKTFAFVSSLFVGTTFINLAYGQTPKRHADSCMVKGKVINNENEIIPNRSVYVYVKNSDSIYETKTNTNGEFIFNLPKNCEIEFSNIEKLISKKIRNRKLINVRKIKLKSLRRAPGFF